MFMDETTCHWFCTNFLSYPTPYNSAKLGRDHQNKLFFCYMTDILLGDRTPPPTLPLDPSMVVIVGPLQWRIQGRGLGGPGPPLIVRPNRGPRGPKNFFWRPGLPLSQGLDDRAAPLSEGLDPPLPCYQNP